MSMREKTRRRLLCLLTGELVGAEADELRQRLSTEPELRRAYRRLEELWGELELPHPAAAPLGFAPRVARAADGVRAATAAQGDRIRWSLAPTWAQAAAALALAGGIVLGLSLASSLAGSTAVDSDRTLAESYWLLLDAAANGAIMEDMAP